MLRAVEFVHEGRRYRAEVQPVPGGGAEFANGGWFVSVDGAPARRVFEANADDADTQAFRHQLLIATWLAEGWERRSGGDRRKAGTRDPGASDRRRIPELGPRST